MTIIFDFNRTIYDPETDTSVPGAIEVLNTLYIRGETLHLISRREQGREKLLSDLGIEHMFASVSFVDEKEIAIQKIIRESSDPVYVVGDHLHDEMCAGNKHGARTVWLKRGKFAELQPETDADVPWRTIESMHELLEIIA